jgi:hypothetical protein
MSERRPITMMTMPRRTLVLALVLLGGCFATEGEFVRTGSMQLPPRPASCSFALYTAAPPAGSIELGVVQFTSPPGERGARDLEDARATAAPFVCAAGGTALVIANVDPKRGIPIATIIKAP